MDNIWYDSGEWTLMDSDGLWGILWIEVEPQDSVSVCAPSEVGEHSHATPLHHDSHYMLNGQSTSIFVTECPWYHFNIFYLSTQIVGTS